MYYTTHSNYKIIKTIYIRYNKGKKKILKIINFSFRKKK